MKVLKWIDEHFEEYLLVFLLVMIACVMMLQIIMRYVFKASLSWAEELTRYCFVWSVFLSISFSIKKGSMLKIDAITSLMPKKMQKVLSILVEIIVFIFLLILLINSKEVITRLIKSGQTSPAMELPMYYVYAASIVGFSLGVIRSIQSIVKSTIKLFKDKSNQLGVS
ncbi:MAG TPA: TRAP transporter small permease [Clostridiales bacterium UBA8960]|nr:TRAP transporter small permease [Clostridiales bacterium UBA8960]